MLISRKIGAATDNLILSALKKEDFERLRPGLEMVRLAQNKIIYSAGGTVRYAYFLIGGMGSLISITEDGKAIEVGMIGNEGLVGITAILGLPISPYQVTMQMAGNAMRIRIDKLLAEFKQGGQLHDLLLRYTRTLLTQLSQSACCNGFHTVEARLCRWLLVSHDRAQSDTLQLTQEFLSQMIGVPRTSVTAIAGKLQSAGLIDYSRGKIRILDKQRLEARSCECYRVIRREFDHFLAA
jgi:CRP-like cAMP-binding protein